MPEKSGADDVIFLVAGCFFVLSCVIAWQAYAAILRDDKFDRERRQWAEERGELLTRIQAPQAAPFMFESKLEDAENDLPLPPEFTIDEEELERAKDELARVGFEDGPVG